ncbi:MAG: glycosyltransferase family 4 protein [bacterium]
MKVISIVTSFPRNEKDVLIPWIIRLIKELKNLNVESEVFTSSYQGLSGGERDGIKVKRFRYFFKRWEKLSHDMSVPEKLKSDKRYFFVLPFFIFFGVVSAFRFGRKNDFDLIHVHFPFPLALFGIAMKIASKKPMVISCHGSEVNMAKKRKVFKVLFKWMTKHADKITVNSSFMKRELLKIIGDREVEIVPMGSGMGEIEFKQSGENKKKGNKIKILYVGRLIELKGVEYLIKAVKMLNPDKYELHIVGDGPERKKLESDEAACKRGSVEACNCEKQTANSSPDPSLSGKKGEKLNCSPLFFKERGDHKVVGVSWGKVTTPRDQRSLSSTTTQLHDYTIPRASTVARPYTFHGYLTGTALEKMYEDADVFVLPSIVDKGGFTEGLGTVLLEAISYGVPVIGSNVGGIPDIVIDGKTGLLVEEKNPAGIAEAIEKIANNPDFASELVANGRVHIEKNFSWETITDKFVRVYNVTSIHKSIC